MSSTTRTNHRSRTRLRQVVVGFTCVDWLSTPRRVRASAQIGPSAWPLDERAVSPRWSGRSSDVETKELHEGRTYRPLRQQ
jgi:hypothetical protein